MNMYDEFVLEMHALANKAKLLHFAERGATLESVFIIQELDNRKAAIALRMRSEDLAVYVGITPAMYWMRLRAARIFKRFPETLERFKQGETEISHVAMLWGKITEANSKLIFENMCGRSKREMESFLSRVKNDGTLLEDEGVTEITIRLKDSERDVFERAREILAHGGKVPSLAETVVKATELLVDRLDPMRKAERAAARAEKRRGKTNEGEGEGEEFSPSSIQPGEDEFDQSCDSSESGGSGPGDLGDYFSHFGLKEKAVSAFAIPRKHARESTTKHRRAIPAAMRHQVWLRDKGECTFEHDDGSVCGETMMIELDHIDMVCFGGEHSVDNLRLRCRTHNRYHAVVSLGEDFMSRWYS
ncbi:MAG: HNH endonuclease [Proteobacteria bacterium]|nr:MAG: HNH endonuclease [Pseudomonadota bacterium]